MSNPLAQSSSDRALVNVVYILSSDSEEEDTKVNVLLSSPHRPGPPRSPPSDKARARDHGEDDQRADPPPPKQGIRRARDEVDEEQDLDETLPSTRKSRKLRADGAPHSQIPTTPKTYSRKRHVPDPGEGEDEAEEDTKPEVTYISSDSESLAAPNKPDKPELPRRKRFRMLMDSVVLPPPRTYSKKNATPSTSTTAGPNRQHEPSRPKASTSSTKADTRGKGKESARNVEPPRGKEPARPEWFKQHLSSVEDQYPETKFRVYFIAEGPQWGVKCLTCKDSKIIVSGPGHSLNNFVQHIKGLSHRMQNGGVIDWHQHSKKGSKAKATQGSSSATKGFAGKSSKAHKRPPKLPVQSQVVPAARVPEDPVVSFLENIGLSLDYADTLRDAGIKDDARMKALGRLSETALDRLETSLAKKGLDISACLLVIEGLKERAMAA